LKHSAIISAVQLADRRLQAAIRMRLSIALLFLLPALASPAVAAGQAPVAAGRQSLQPGDMVKISVWRKPELSGDFFVAADSSIADPFYAPVKVVGIPFPEVESRVRGFLSQTETSPRVWVEPLFRVMVGGEVRTPNIYPMRRETTLSEAVFLAGGPTERGRLDQVRLVRDGEIHTLDLSNPNGEAARMRIDSGDRILLGRQRKIFRDYVLPTVFLAGSTASLIRLLFP
jgi:polysaccharide export outer membrane protein